MKQVSLQSKAAVLAASLALGAAWAASRAWAFNPQPDPPGISGMVGIVEGQTARLNAVNISSVPVHVTLNFFNSDGNVVKRTEGTLQPGHAAFLDLTRAEVGDRGDSSRAEIYGDMVLLPAVQKGSPPDPCRPTLEVFDGNGKTTVLDTNFHKAPALSIASAD